MRIDAYSRESGRGALIFLGEPEGGTLPICIQILRWLYLPQDIAGVSE
jgi:hypothetical protein